MDQRRLIVVTQLIIAALTIPLGIITMAGLVEVWHLLTIAFLTGAVEAFDQPARRSLFPHLVERKDMMSAVAMNSSHLARHSHCCPCGGWLYHRRSGHGNLLFP